MNEPLLSRRVGLNARQGLLSPLSWWACDSEAVTSAMTSSTQRRDSVQTNSGLWLLPFVLHGVSRWGHCHGPAVVFHTSSFFCFFSVFLILFISLVYFAPSPLSFCPSFALSLFSSFLFLRFLLLLCQKCMWKEVLLPPVSSLPQTAHIVFCPNLSKTAFTGPLPLGLMMAPILF